MNKVKAAEKPRDRMSEAPIMLKLLRYKYASPLKTSGRMGSEGKNR